MRRLDRTSVLTALAAVAACAIGALALFALPASEVPLTYRAAAHGAQVIGVAAGAALVAAALLARQAALAGLLLALATAWFGQDLAALGDDQAPLDGIAFA